VVPSPVGAPGIVFVAGLAAAMAWLLRRTR
jgi:hypothetical protein